MLRRPAASSWVSPSVRRRRRRAERIDACESSGGRIAFSFDLDLNNPAPIDAPKRAAFDRWRKLVASSGRSKRYYHNYMSRNKCQVEMHTITTDDGSLTHCG